MAASKSKSKGPKAPPGQNKPGNAPADPSVYVRPVQVDGRNRRSDNDALEGGFCRIVKGDHEGALGVFDRVDKYDKDGWPEQVNVVLRDSSVRVSVPYADVRPESQARRGV